MKVGLGIPFWGNDPLRLKNHEWVVSYMLHAYPFDKMIGMTEGCTTRGGARNRLMDQLADCDVVVLCDADTVPEVSGLKAAIMAAYVHGGLQFAYDRFRALNGRGTDLLMAGNPTAAYEHLASVAEGGLGGVMAIRPDQWWKAGGSPELEGWGFEDVIFAVQARTLLTTDNAWSPGWITHLWHPTECSVGSEQYNKNIAVCKKYEAASWDKPAIKELLRERNEKNRT